MKTLLGTILALAWTYCAQANSTEIQVNQSIPDGDPSGLASTINLSGLSGTIGAVQLDLNISGTYTGDLYAYLVHGGGFSILLNRPGRTASDSLGYGDGGLNVTFADGAANGDIHNYRSSLFGNASTALSGPLTGTWSPDGRQSSPFGVTDADARTALLSSFDGLDPNGDWTLFVADLSGGDLHQLNSWGLELGTVAASVTDTGSTAGLLALGIAALVWAVQRTRPSSSFRRDRWVRATQRASQLVLISVALALPGGPAVASEGGSVTVWGGFVMYPLNGYGATFTKIAAGSDHNLTITREGTVVAWGDNSWGECEVPEGLWGLVAVSAGSRHSLALRGDGTVVAWGANYAGQCDVPGGLTGVMAISAGWHHSLALTGGGTVVAWGSNEFGQCDVPTDLGSVVAIAAGGDHNLALRSDGTVAAWGVNDLGQCDVPSGLQGVKAIAAGGEQSLALKSDGTVVAWGAFSSQLPAGLSNVTAIAAGAFHGLALIADGSVVAWGDDWYGQLEVPGSLRGVVAIAGGTRHSVALKRDGMLVSWGSPVAQTTSPTGLTDILSIAAGGGPNDVMTLVLKSDGTVMTTSAFGDSIFPLPDGLDNVVAVAAGGRHYLALRRNGAVVAWGDYSGLSVGAAVGATAIAAGDGRSLAVGPYGNVLAWVGDKLEHESTVPWNAQSEVVAVAAGNGFSLALRTDGTVVAWGDNSEGQCDVPAGLTGVVSISAQYEHSLALRADGTIVAWGQNFFGQCDVPPGLSNVLAIAAGHYHSLALKADGTVAAWGAQPQDPRLQTLTAVPRNLSGVTAIAAGEMGSIALFGNVNHPPSAGAYQLTTSRNTSVSVGLFDLHQACSDPDWDTFIVTSVSPSSASGGTAQINGSTVLYTPPLDFVGSDWFTYTVRDCRGAISQGAVNVTVAESRGGIVTSWGGTIVYPLAGIGARFTKIAAGLNHNLALKTDGTVVPWGYNGSSDNILGPCDVPSGLSEVVAIAAGDDDDMALKKDGTVVCWGFYLLSIHADHGNTRPCIVPSGLSDVTSIAAGGSQCYALKSDGTVVAWGFSTLNDVPATVPSGLAGVSAIAAGHDHCLALKGDGTAVAWGENPWGQCDVPSGLSGVVAIAGGWSHSLALKGDGTVVAWGDNRSGECDVPAGLSGVKAIAAGAYFSLALKSDGTVAAWGANDAGQFDVPSGLIGVVAIAATGDHSVALKLDGTVVTWGGLAYDRIQDPISPKGVVAIAAGDNGTFALLKEDGTIVGWPEPPSGLSGLVAVTAGNGHALALKPDGTVVAWGNNTLGQCDVPSGLGKVVAIAASSYYSLALKEDGTVVAWGDNRDGECAVPVGLDEVVAVAAGEYHSVALKSDGTVVCWGPDSSDPPSGLGGVVAISAGGEHTLALKQDGTVVAWGANYQGQCDMPTGLDRVVGISAGVYHSVAIRADGTIVAWGDNSQEECNIPTGLTGVTAISASWGSTMALFEGGATRPPIAASYHLETTRNSIATLGLFKLHNACSDPDWDTFIITRVSPSSVAGGRAEINGGTITYTPPKDFVGSDSFAYTVRDSRGGISQGTVQVQVKFVGPVTIPAIFNTGVDANHAVLADGTLGDPHFTLINLPGGTASIRVRSSAGGWPIQSGMYLADDSLSAWIGPNNDQSLNSPGGSYVFRTSFHLGGFDPSTARIAGQWSTDNEGVDILLNGISIGNGANPDALAFQHWTTFNIDAGFVAGINTLDFILNNQGLGPTAVRVEMIGTANRLLAPATYELGTSRNQVARLSAEKLLRACVGSDDGGFSVSAVSSESTVGGSVELTGNVIVYAPPLDFVGTDSFTYTLTESGGASWQGTVHVTVTVSAGSGPNILGVSVQPGGTATIRFAGIPGEVYSLEASTDLITWKFLNSVTAGPNGLLQFIDSEAAQYSTRYYRTRYGAPVNP